MTSFVAWIGIDSRGPSSIYLASDSRISWSCGGNISGTWDCGQKLFASTKFPEILGYYGDTFFPSHVLSQCLDLIDAGILFDIDDKSETKFQKLVSIVRRSFKQYPINQGPPFTIVYCTRENSGMATVFHTATLRWHPKRDWDTKWFVVPEESDVILSGGSGKQSVNHWYQRWSQTTEKGTSRSVFGAFCDSLQSGEDKYSGGPPQLVGIHRVGSAKAFGIIFRNKRFLFGLNVDKAHKLEQVMWFNSLFERCDWQNKRALRDAQKHRRPPELWL